MFDLRERLKETFGDVEIVTLKLFTKKISVISKVRIGKERDVTEYYEVTLSDVNVYGIIEVDERKAFPEPANSRAIDSQRLHKNDILVSYRGLDMKVGRIDREYKIPVVSNNSAIRIQFASEYGDTKEEEEISHFVLHYLQLPYVKEYIDSRPQSDTNNRKLLSPNFLADLPIPLFQSGYYEFKDFITNRLKMLVNAEEMMQEMQNLVKRLEHYKEEGLSLYLSEEKFSLDISQRDLELLKELEEWKQKIVIYSDSLVSIE